VLSNAGAAVIGAKKRLRDTGGDPRPPHLAGGYDDPDHPAGVSALRKGVRAGGYRTAIATIAVFLEKAHSGVHESEGGR
jgi:hypothetical protein